MRGSPLLRAFIAFVLIGLCGYPIWRLTQARAVSPTQRSTEKRGDGGTKEHEAEIRLTFTAPPNSVKVLHLGKEIFGQSAPDAEIERVLALRWPADGVDLRFQVEWPEAAGLAAMRVQVTGPDGEEHDQSVWGTGATDEVLTFK